MLTKLEVEVSREGSQADSGHHEDNHGYHVAIPLLLHALVVLTHAWRRTRGGGSRRLRLLTGYVPSEIITRNRI